MIEDRYRAELPAGLAEQVGGALLVCMATDLREDGSFGERFLVVTADEVVALEEGREPLRFALGEIEGASVDSLFGAGRIVLKQEDGGKAEAICYSRDLVSEFSAAARIIDQLAKGDADAETLIYPDLEPPARSPKGVQLSERGATSPTEVPRMEVLGKMWDFLRDYRGKVYLMMALITVSVVAQLAIPLLTKFIVDDILRKGEVVDAAAAGDQLNVLVLLIGVCFLVILATRTVANTVKAWVSVRLIADLRARLHRQLGRLKMAYHDRHESGQIVGRVMNDTAELQHFLIDGLPFFLINALTFIGIGIMLVWLHPLLALCVFLPVPILIGGGSWFWKKLVPLFHKTGNRRGTLHSDLSQSIAGVKAVKALGREDDREEVFEKTNEGLFTVNFSVNRTFIRFFEVMAFVMGLGTVAVWYFGGHSVLDPNSGFGFGHLIAFIGYMAMFYAPLQWFTAVMNWMSNAFASAERILQILNQEPEEYDKEGAVALPTTEGALAFEDVRFSYTRGTEVIKGISFRAEPGQMIGLVGKSGAGKSTVIQLLCRFYEADSGRVTIDGHDLRDVSLADWRSHIGIVMQDPFLFGASIAENIACGKPGASFEEVVEAARAAHAHEFILDKEEGYDTVVGDGGADLSGGEKQRIAIARAILGDPKVLILDEATSAVDAETEKAIQGAIAKLVEGRTTIAIAHRLATLRNADRLIVVGDGEILEEGTHAELLEKDGGHFANLVRLQSENNQLRREQLGYAEDEV